MMFMSWLAQSLSPASISVYLAAVWSLNIDLGFPDPTKDTPDLQSFKIYPPLSFTISPQRRPITQEALTAIHAILATVVDDYDASMFWASCCIAFYGFLRVSEFTSRASFSQAGQLALADVEFLPNAPLTAVKLRIKALKTDPLGVGCVIYIGQSFHELQC